MGRLCTTTTGANCIDRREILDRQSQKLLIIFNRHKEIHKSGSGDYFSIVKDLIDYVSVTFPEENKIMMQANYPAFLKHAREHQEFTQKIDEFLQGYKQGDLNLGFKIFSFLKDWIRDHTSKLDVEFTQYMGQNGVDLDGLNEYEKSFENYLFA